MKLSFALPLLLAAGTASAFQLPISMSSSHQPQQPSSQPRRQGQAAVDRRAHAWGSAGAVLAGAGAVLAGGSPLTQPARADVPEEGIDAPDFTLPSSLGKPLSLGELRKSGKFTVLYFFPQVFTSSCTLEAKAFQRDIEQYNKLNAQIVGVSVDESDKQTDFKSECGLDFLLLSDKGAKVSEAYGSALDIPFLGRFSNRQTYIISPTGKLVKVFTNVESKVKKHSEEVIEALKALQG